MVTSTSVAEAGERLVDGVVDDFVNEVMQARGHRVTPMYIAGRLRTASRPFEYLDLVGAVFLGCAVGRRRDTGVERAVVLWFQLIH